MNTDLAEANILAQGVKSHIPGITSHTVVLCPPSPWLVAVAEILRHHPVAQLAIGAQNIYYKDAGAYTGEISTSMLKRLVQYVIVGHSERRKYFHETDEEVRLKVKKVVEAGMTAVVCVGELKRPKDDLLQNPHDLTAKDMQLIMVEVDAAVDDLTEAELKKVIIAYEPVWAIGGSGEGIPATGVYANHIANLIRQHIARRHGALAKDVPILYGGSVNPENTVEFARQPELNGFLVGGASLKIQSFLEICRLSN